jgi:antitoxin ParD1/3/4
LNRKRERLDRHDAERLEGLRRAWQAGIDSGDAGPLDFDELRAAAQQQLAARQKG